MTAQNGLDKVGLGVEKQEFDVFAAGQFQIIARPGFGRNPQAGKVLFAL